MRCSCFTNEQSHLFFQQNPISCFICYWEKVPYCDTCRWWPLCLSSKGPRMHLMQYGYQNVYVCLHHYGKRRCIDHRTVAMYPFSPENALLHSFVTTWCRVCCYCKTGYVQLVMIWMWIIYKGRKERKERKREAKARWSNNKKAAHWHQKQHHGCNFVYLICHIHLQEPNPYQHLAWSALVEGTLNNVVSNSNSTRYIVPNGHDMPILDKEHKWDDPGLFARGQGDDTNYTFPLA